MKKFLWTKAQLEGISADLKVMEQKLRYPSGTRPYKGPEELAQLDEPLFEAQHCQIIFEIVLEKGISHREAMQTVHHYMSKCHKNWLQEAHTAHLDTLKPVIS